MARWLLSTVATFSLLSAWVSAQGGTKCGPGSLCPEDRPCCSQYGECGLGAYCLGGCDPIYSHSLDSCLAAPVCKSQDYKLTSLDGMQSNTEFLGDASKADWVYSGEPKKYNDNNGDQVLLTMPEKSVGTLLASTTYVWYGKVSATMKTSRGKGVVTAFILLSDVKDEIDFEFVGTNLEGAQSNYYFQGITDYTHGDNHTVDTDTFENYHTYEIDWQPDQITWSIDGKQQRQVKKSDTYNKTSNRYDYPQTPSRVQLSLWPAGLSTNGEGTISWAGGLIDWKSPDIQNAHYYYAMVKEVKIECYQPPSDVKKSGDKAYWYDNVSGVEGAVEIGNNNTVLKSFIGSGLQPDAGAPVSSGSASSAMPSATDAPTIPGLTGAGTGSNGQRGGSGSSDTGGNGGASAGGAGASATSTQSGAAPTGTGFHGFDQGNGNTNAGSTLNPKGEKVLQGSMLAVLLAIAGMLIL